MDTRCGGTVGIESASESSDTPGDDLGLVPERGCFYTNRTLFCVSS